MNERAGVCVERGGLNRAWKMSSGKMEGPSAPAVRRDPYEVLSVTRESSDQEIKSAYRKLALKYVLNSTFSITLILLVSFIYHFRARSFLNSKKKFFP